MSCLEKVSNLNEDEDEVGDKKDILKLKEFLWMCGDRQLCKYFCATEVWLGFYVDMKHNLDEVEKGSMNFSRRIDGNFEC